MKNQIAELEIQNFKSIKQLKINCKRINLFIGKPNVGKSNILEAVSLLGAPYEQNRNKFLSSFIRYENFDNLFYDNDLQKKIQILTNLGVASIKYSHKNNSFNLALAGEKANLLLLERRVENNINSIDKNSFNYNPKHSIQSFYIVIDSNRTILDHSLDNIEQSNNPIKKYDFTKLEKHENRFPAFLLPPYGNNLFTILQGDKSFYKELTPLFKEYGLQLVLKIQEHKFEIQKNIDGIVYSYPYSTIADTLQRIIFYLTAIESNKESVLLFEEPEAHAFPPYTRMLADRIVQSKENQFFITTHSPYLLHTIIENTPFEELGVFVTYFEDYQTRVKALSQEKIRDVLDDSIDVFFNLDRLLSDE